MGMFIKLLINVFYDVLPFVYFYMIFTTFFALCFAALDANTNEDLATGGGLGDFGRLWLMIWRNSLTKLSMPLYDIVLS